MMAVTPTNKAENTPNPPPTNLLNVFIINTRIQTGSVVIKLPIQSSSAK